MLDEACSQQRMNLRELIDVQDPLTPHPIHVHEVEAVACIARPYLSPVEHYRLSRSNSSNDSRIDATAWSLDLAVRECFRNEHTHAACNDLMSRDWTFRFNNVREKRRVVE